MLKSRSAITKPACSYFFNETFIVVKRKKIKYNKDKFNIRGLN